MINLLIILIILILYTLYHNKGPIEGFEEEVNNMPDFNPEKVNFPFKNITTPDGKPIKVIAITAYFREDKHRKMYEKAKKLGYEFIGVSSYLEFPGKINNPHEDKYHMDHNDDYETMVNGWVHCFRDPKKYIKSDIPLLFLSESDFICFNQFKPNTSVQKKYDIMYVCLDDNKDKCVEGWQAYNRNWELAKRCFDLICQQNKDIKILIVGRVKCKTKDPSGQIKKIPFQKQNEFLKYMNKSRILFAPNISDASPRVITQALCYDLRILVNYNILGGWKYVNCFTGEFMNNEYDCYKNLDKILINYNKYKPREWYMQHFGLYNSGKKMLDFLKVTCPSVDYHNMDHVIFRW